MEKRQCPRCRYFYRRRSRERRAALPGLRQLRHQARVSAPAVTAAASASLHRQRQRLPAGDGPGALPRLRVVGDAGEPPAQLDRSRELAALLVDGADRSGIRLGDDEHRWSMGRRGGRQRTAAGPSTCWRCGGLFFQGGRSNSTGSSRSGGAPVSAQSSRQPIWRPLATVTAGRPSVSRRSPRLRVVALTTKSVRSCRTASSGTATRAAAFVLPRDFVECPQRGCR